MAERAYKQARAIIPSMTVQLKGRTLKATSVPLVFDDYDADLSGVAEVIRGAIRLVVSELGPNLPESGDKIAIKDSNKDWQTYRIKGVTPDNYSGSDEGAVTMMVTYGLEQS